MNEFAERYYREVVTRKRKDPRNIRRYLNLLTSTSIWSQFFRSGDREPYGRPRTEFSIAAVVKRPWYRRPGHAGNSRFRPYQ